MTTAINENIFVNIYQLSKRARFINSYNLCVDILNAAKLTIKLSKMQGKLRNPCIIFALAGTLFMDLGIPETELGSS